MMVLNNNCKMSMLQTSSQSLSYEALADHDHAGEELLSMQHAHEAYQLLAHSAS